jgi:hypothetical protein
MQIGGNNMWKEQLLKPITTTDSNVPTKPKRKKGCCEQAKQEYFDISFNPDNPIEHIASIKELPCQLLYVFITDLLRVFPSHKFNKKWQELLDRWDKCEGR